MLALLSSFEVDWIDRKSTRYSSNSCTSSDPTCDTKAHVELRFSLRKCCAARPAEVFCASQTKSGAYIWIRMRSYSGQHLWNGGEFSAADLTTISIEQACKSVRLHSERSVGLPFTLLIHPISGIQNSVNRLRSAHCCLHGWRQLTISAFE